METLSQYPASLRVRQRDRHIDKQTGSSYNQGWEPCPFSGGRGDYMLWSARGPYWGTCRASVNPRFQIKVTGGVKLQNPSPSSPFQVKSSISAWCSQKVSQNCPVSLHHLWQYIQSLLSYLTTILSWNIFNVTHSTSIQSVSQQRRMFSLESWKCDSGLGRDRSLLTGSIDW